MSLKHIELCFLPPNATAAVQPLNQGIIRAFKHGYQKRLVERLLAKLRVGHELKIDLLAAIEMLSRAWSDVTPETIRNCFRHVGLATEPSQAASLDHGPDQYDSIGALWEELANVPDAVPEGVSFEDFLGCRRRRCRDCEPL